MATVLNRSTLEYIEGVNTPDYDSAIWIINPDLTAVSGHPTRHWQINDDSTVTLKSAEAIGLADTAYLPTYAAQRILALRSACQGYIYDHYDQPRQSSLNALLVEATIMGYTTRIQYIGQTLAWIKSVIAYYYTKEDAINSAPSMAEVDGVIWDFPGQFDTSDPAITLRGASNLN